MMHLKLLVDLEDFDENLRNAFIDAGGGNVLHVRAGQSFEGTCPLMILVISGHILTKRALIVHRVILMKTTAFYSISELYVLDAR